MELSYASGTSTTPLLGDTIGDNLDRTIARFGDREALVSVHQDLRYTYAQFGEAVDRCAPRVHRRRDRARRPGRDLEPELRRVGARPVRARPRPGSSWSTSTRPTGRPSSPTCSTSPACKLLVAATAFKTSDYVQMVDDVRGDCDGARAGRVHRARLGGVHRRRRAGVARTSCAQRQAATQFDDPINIQYTSGTTGFPKGATLSHHNILNNGYFVGRGCRYTRAGPGLHPGALLPLLRHGHGQPRVHVARRLHGHPGAGVRPGRDAAGRAGRALHVALRRADDVHRRARAPGVRRVRPDVAAHRDHGRLAVPDRDDEALRERDAHGGGDDLLRHDRDVAGLHPDGRRRPAREARRHRRAGAPARRGQGRRPRERRDRRARRAGRAVHARLQRDARLLERAGEDRRRDRPRALDAHRRPRADGRRGLPEDRRPHQGHGHPRRRERLPARDRGVPDDAPGRRRTSRSSACPIPSTARS